MRCKVDFSGTEWEPRAGLQGKPQPSPFL